MKHVALLPLSIVGSIACAVHSLSAMHNHTEEYCAAFFEEHIGVLGRLHNYLPHDYPTIQKALDTCNKKLLLQCMQGRHERVAKIERQLNESRENAAHMIEVSKSIEPAYCFTQERMVRYWEEKENALAGFWITLSALIQASAAQQYKGTL